MHSLYEDTIMKTTKQFEKGGKRNKIDETT
jgi:hypothetical protein